VEEAVKNMQPQDVLLLENLRFHPGEEANDPAFAKALASLADVFVMDAFGVAHREHASVVGVTKYLPSGAGFLLQREIELLGRALNSPAKPFGAIFGGAKVSDKILVMEKLLEKLDAIFIGGGLVATFLHSLGYPTGASRVEIDRAPVAARMLKLAKEREIKVFLPVDVVVAESFKPDARHSINVHIEDIPPGWVIMDIGRRTLDLYKLELSKCKMVVWNGPMGVFEFPSFAQGTSKIAQTLANLNAITIVGGGSTAEAVEQLGLVYRMTHVSTGGGASMEFLEGRELPGIRALPDKDR
jgi:phosphoglycerate kinase